MSPIPPRLRRALAGALAAIVVAAPAIAQVVPASPDDILRQTAEVRGLPQTRDVPTASMDRGALQGLLTRELESDLAIREYRISGILLETLGLIPAGFDLRLHQIELLREQVGGLYHREERRLYLIADGGPLGALDKVILAHEMTHALQDQHFDLARLLPATGLSDDALKAASALLEGDATLTMQAWGRRFLTPAEKASLDQPRAGSGALAAAPLIVRDELEFPYREGLFFAVQLHQDGGYDALNAALADPPRSTEQIIHPEKYLAREAPRPVTLPPLAPRLPGGDWRLLRTEVLGEHVLRVMIQETLGWPDAEAAAAGWGGDAYAVLEDDDGRRLVAIETVWDTEPDAAEFYNAYARAVARRFGSAARQVVNQPSRVEWATPTLRIGLVKTNDRVRLVFAPDAATLDAADAVLAGGQPGPVAPGAGQPVPAGGATPTPTPVVFPPEAPASGSPTPAATATPAATPAPDAPTRVPRPPVDEAPGETDDEAG